MCRPKSKWYALYYMYLYKEALRSENSEEMKELMEKIPWVKLGEEQV